MLADYRRLLSEKTKASEWWLIILLVDKRGGALETSSNERALKVTQKKRKVAHYIEETQA